jgi:hypothetical protein
LCAVAVDESTDAKILLFVRGVNEIFELVEELLELVSMKGKTGVDETVSQLVTL